MHQISDNLRERFRLFLGISLGIFLFVLFFEPFSVFLPDLKNRLAFLVGLSVIILFLMVLVYVVFTQVILVTSLALKEWFLSSYVKGFILTVLITIALAFYLRFVGETEMSFFNFLKILFISLFPAVAISLHDSIENLKRHNEELIAEMGKTRLQVEKYEENLLARSIELSSVGAKDNFRVAVADIICLVSADNYVEVIYRKDEQYEKKLLRNTLKGLQQLLAPYSFFLRIHRTCVVNIHFIDQFRKTFNSYWVSLKGLDRKLPVSRQYLLKVREVL
ncbi:LytR/AlgR family response regulator transcription factor [Marinilabilia sp.]